MEKIKEKQSLVRIKSIVTLSNPELKGKVKSRGGGYTWVG